MIFDDWRGEVMPLCSACDTCGRYYKSKAPADVSHWKQIEDDLRRDIAVAIAGEIATTEICGYESLDKNELLQDHDLSICRASVIHYRKDKRCLRFLNETCRVCEDYIMLTTNSVRRMILQPTIRTCIEELAARLEQRNNHQRMGEKEMNEFFDKRNFTRGSAFDSIPHGLLQYKLKVES